MSRMPKSFAKGRYTVLEKIGEGFTSAVYLVLDEAVDSKVALKIANPRTSADTNLVKRFEQEIYILERFQHRNLVKHINHGFERGRPFLVMEYVEGLSLNNWLKSHRETVEIIEILIQLLQALKYVHSKGVVHRDMKPSNVIIIETFNGNHLKIIDFGFARWLDGNEHITMTGEIVGSPAYMAPEQIRSSVTVDHRCDIFTFGIIAFEAFAGVLPFAGDSPSETAYKIFSEPPSSLLEIRSDLPDALINLIEKCLDKQVYQRPPNADAVIDELSMIKEKLL